MLDEKVASNGPEITPKPRNCQQTAVGEKRIEEEDEAKAKEATAAKVQKIKEEKQNVQ